MKDNQEEQNQIRRFSSSLASSHNKDFCQEFYPSNCALNAQQEFNFKRLYPFVDESKNPLPRLWSSKDKYQLLSLTHDDLRLHYKGQGKSHKDAAAVRANYPIPAACGLYYFEIRIINKGRDGLFGIGLSQSGVSLNRLPGWDKFSFGYHGDDGHCFSFSGSGVPYGPTFSTGDIIGCGLNLIDNHCFYTKNGYNIGIAFTDLPPELYPTVGLQTPGEVVEANFGQFPFAFDIYEEIKLIQLRIRAAIQAFDVPMNKTDCFNKLVSSYLVHHGYSATAESFNKMTDQTAHEDNESIKRRSKISKLILSGRISEAICLVQKIYPGLLDKNKNLLFMLRCRQFVEMVAGNDEASRTTPTGFYSTSQKLGASFGNGCRAKAASPDSPPISTTGPIHQHRHHHHHSHANISNGRGTPPTKKHTATTPHLTPSPKESPRNSPRSSAFASASSPTRLVSSNGADSSSRKASSLPPALAAFGRRKSSASSASVDGRSSGSGVLLAMVAPPSPPLVDAAETSASSSFANGCDKIIDQNNGYSVRQNSGDERPATFRKDCGQNFAPPPLDRNGFCAGDIVADRNGTVHDYAALVNDEEFNLGEKCGDETAIDFFTSKSDEKSVNGRISPLDRNGTVKSGGDCDEDATMLDVSAYGCAANGSTTGRLDKEAAMDIGECDEDDEISAASVLATDANVALVHFGRELHHLSTQIFSLHQQQRHLATLTTSGKQSYAPYGEEASIGTPNVDFGETRRVDVSSGFLPETHASSSGTSTTKELKMMHDAFSLMAYSNPWISPVSQQLEPQQREPVAAALNSLILETHGYQPKPPLQLIVAHAQRLRDEMAKIGLGSAAFADPLDCMRP